VQLGPRICTSLAKLTITQLFIARSQSAKAEANQAVAEVLSDALPFIMDHTGETIVIKYGGHAMEDATASLQFAKDIVLLKSCGVNPVIVHGGGPQVRCQLHTNLHA
jgi:acetylglutamate kinase